MWVGDHLEIQPPILCLVTEGPRDHFEDAGKEDIFGLHRNRPRFDLGKIQNVADQVQQVSPRAMNRSGEFNLLGCKVLVRVVAELLAKNENAVQRRAQLMGHVGQELGLVLGRQRQFLGLFFDRPARLLNFLVLAFHLDVLLGELLGFLRQLLIGLLQFCLLALKLAGQLLGLLQQSFGLHRCLNAVQQDADARR